MRRKTRKRAVLLCCGVLSLAGVWPAANAEEGLGRLFFSPERRQHLDHQRQMNLQTQVEIPPDPTLTINGVVMRSSGKRTVWVNGVAQNENETSDDLLIVPLKSKPGRVAVQVGDIPAAQVGVGATVNRNSGETVDLLGEGTIRIGRSQREK